MEKIRVGIVGAAGYTGSELIRLLEMHPRAELGWLMTGNTNSGKAIARVFPHLRGVRDGVFLPLDPEGAEPVDLVFMAMPHGMAAALVPAFLERGSRVIDLSADCRLKDAAVYRKWYDREHDAPDLLREAVYGLTELYRRHLPGVRLVANPGCYPTVSVLCLAPLLAEGRVRLDSIVIDAKSGVSGAGRGLTLGTHYAECNEDFLAYKPAAHRHMPEIEQELSFLAGEPVTICFVPHLVPMIRGMMATVYCRPARPVGDRELQDLYESFYRNEPFVQVLNSDELPRTKEVQGTNRCEIAVRYDPRSETVLVLGVIDNLVKGASGQAVQNMNVVFGFPETDGLSRVGLYP
jgi:N-acetyl-gamma-glutamyl-phosphate reductase